MTPAEWTGIVVAVLAALGTSGGIGSHIAARRATRAGISDRDAQARAEEMRDRREAAKAAAERTETELARLTHVVETQQEEINELRQWQRDQFARETAHHAALMEHGGWDWVALDEAQKAGITLPPVPPLSAPPRPRLAREDD